MLYKLNSLKYPDLIDYANTYDCGSVYPLSVVEGIQKGDIFTNSVRDYEKVLFWTHSGFAYLSGKMDEHFLEDIYEFMSDRTKLHTKRFLLMTRDKYIQEYFEQKATLLRKKDIYFSIQERKDI